MLAEIIRQRIASEGPISFHDFMEMCLYYPDYGYYTSAGDKIGIQGDFYTNSSIGSVFGVMVGRQLEEMWGLTGQNKFTIVEYGAGTGMLCHDILLYAKRNKRFYHQLDYFIIEKSTALREKQRRLLTDKVKWCNSINDLGSVTGCILSNEVIDNFSIHRVVMKETLMEVFVDFKGQFMEILRPARPSLGEYFRELGVVLAPGSRAEINLEALEWIREISDHLDKGYVLTVDYGHLSKDLYNNKRSEGTIACYYRHQVNNDAYINPGEQDITSHVNFSALAHWGYKNGLDPNGYTTQASFMVNLGWDDYMNELLLRQPASYFACRRYLILKYTLLVDMGQKFNVLIQQKGLPAIKLKCFNEGAKSL